MRILSCEINKVPVKTILDTASNCNIIGKGLVDILGLDIDTSHKEEAKLLIPFPSQKSLNNLDATSSSHCEIIEDSIPILGMVHNINPSFRSKTINGNRWRLTIF